MQINIKTLNVDLTPSLETYIGSKLQPIKKFLARFEREGEVQVSLDLARTTRHHKHGDVFKASLGLRLGKKVFHAEEEADDARVAIDRARDTLRSEIEKYKLLLKPKRGDRK
ncbi:MAG TPA: ribosome-associated translation inhibitor RaiA [Candidatus Paceibacterota bacterium]|nr:ribosome-associated translation inhibitor RaiA [Candidatus Paceibacterota bacterium]